MSDSFYSLQYSRRDLAHYERDFPRSTEILRLDQSGFSGPIPSEVGMLAELKELTATLNRLTGTVPEDLGQLSNLVLFELKSNHNMSGTFPSTLCEIGGTELINKCFPDCSCCGDCAGG